MRGVFPWPQEAALAASDIITVIVFPGLYDGPFPWENTLGFHLAGMVCHDFFKPYAVTFDFNNLQILLQ